MPQPPRNRALLVAAGILSSRLFGYLRSRAVAHYFGLGPYADVLQAALRAPNLLQNLLGEGTLSASFIPVYSRFLARGREREAGRFAGAALGLLMVVVALSVAAGVLFARPLVAVLTPGFATDAAAVAAGEATVDRFPLAVTAVRLIFPMTGMLVLSVWALGVLNSHRRFFLPYFAPVLWNLAILTALVGGGRLLAEAGGAPFLERLLFATCFGALAGGFLQLAVQLPLVARLLRGFRLTVSTRVVGVKEALAAFGPVVAGRGVVQLGGYLDLVLASLLTAGALGALAPAQFLYLLPVSLFGLSVAAAELPELARAHGRSRDDAAASGEEPATPGTPELPPEFVARLASGLGQSAFFTVPSALGYLVFGLPLVGALFRTGRFGAADAWLVYLVLAGYSLGLVASTASRLLQNSFYALGLARVPARIAVSRVVAAAAAAVPLMLWLDRFPVSAVAGPVAGGDTLRLGAAGLALGSAVGAWLEVARLGRALRRQVTGFGLPWRRLALFCGLAVAAALPAAGIWWLLPALHPVVTAAAVAGPYAAVYLLLAAVLRLDELAAWTGRLRRRTGAGDGGGRNISGGDEVE